MAVTVQGLLAVLGHFKQEKVYPRMGLLVLVLGLEWILMLGLLQDLTDTSTLILVVQPMIITIHTFILMLMRLRHIIFNTDRVDP